MTAPIATIDEKRRGALKSLTGLYGFKIVTRDSYIGRATEFFFDDRSWHIRYLVVDTGGWLPDRKVLIVPDAFGELDNEWQVVPVALTREQVEKSPGIAADEPVSPRHEIAVDRYYSRWLHHAADAPSPGELQWQEGSDKSPHLRSSREIIGYTLHAAGENVGHIADMLFDDQSWVIRYIVAALEDRLSGKKEVLVAPEWITAIDAVRATIQVDLHTKVLRDSPAYDPTREVSRDDEARLYTHYGKS
ncbi:MAG: PRC-barrel domain-containing protein [Nitrospirota bacterium]